MRLNGDDLPLCRLVSNRLRPRPADRDLTTMQEQELDRSVIGERLVELGSPRPHLRLRWAVWEAESGGTVQVRVGRESQ